MIVAYELASDTGIGSSIGSGMGNSIGTRASPKLYIYATTVIKNCTIRTLHIT
jgi:hypothetical protein